MEMSAKAWLEYAVQRSNISQRAIDMMQAWLDKNPEASHYDTLNHAYNLVMRYGQATGALSCKMYEATAEAQGAAIATAEMADLPNYDEVGKAVNGTMKQSKSVADTVGRLIKQVGEDTILKNAGRDGAEFAWVPSGDSCAFCITLASRGWQHMSKAARNGNHAEHIHANCDCTYAVRFDGKSTVAGYDPDKYLAQYNSAKGNSSQAKINFLRRENYARNKDSINEQKRAAYAKRKTGLAMNLQFFAKVPDEKLKGYALNAEHPVGKEKAVAFREALGYTQENYTELKKKILESFNEDELAYKREDKYGKRYELIMQITGLNGKTATVVTAWIKENDASEPRLTSVYVDKRKKA